MGFSSPDHGGEGIRCPPSDKVQDTQCRHGREPGAAEAATPGGSRVLTRGKRGGQGSGPAPGMRAMNTDTRVPSSLQTHTHAQLRWQFLWTQGLHGPPLFRSHVRILDVQDATGLGRWL